MHDDTLSVRDLVKRFGSLVALDHVSFDVRPGELFGFVGANGAGKTTTMRIIMGVNAADAGEVRWGGATIGRDGRRRIGYMPEERGLYPKMALLPQLVFLARLHGMGPQEAYESSKRWIGRLGLSGREHSPIEALSHGNQQRAQLAGALVFSPELAILDEPFAGLDPIAVDTMKEVLREESRRGMTIIFSSHQLELVEDTCDRVGIIRSGRMVAVGSLEELSAHRLEELWVDAPAAPPSWADGLEGVKVLESEGTRLLLELAPGADDQAILLRALATGPVADFHRHRPTLSELFRSAVSAPNEEESDVR